MGTLVCTIEMDKKDGLTVTINNENGKVKQTIKMDGTTITLTVAGESATSTTTQDSSKISIACKQFELKAEETISISSGKASTYKSDDALDITSAKNMTLHSNADVKVTAQNISATGD